MSVILNSKGETLNSKVMEQEIVKLIRAYSVCGGEETISVMDANKIAIGAAKFIVSAYIDIIMEPQATLVVKQVDKNANIEKTYVKKWRIMKWNEAGMPRAFETDFETKPDAEKQLGIYLTEMRDDHKDYNIKDYFVESYVALDKVELMKIGDQA